jgi:hypothetical protein
MKNRAPQHTHLLLSPSTTSFLLRTKTLSKGLIYATALIAFALAAAPVLQAQTCENIPNPGTESLVGKIRINGTNNPVTQGMAIPVGTSLRFDSVIEATGDCTGMAWANTNPPSCEPTGYVYQRVPNHTEVTVEIATETQPLGFYVGFIYGTGGPNQHVINSESSDSTGPVFMTALP